MARSPFTLAAAVTAALPGAEVVGARELDAGGEGRFDSAVVTLGDGRELAMRVAVDDEGDRELAAEALALRTLTPGARAMLSFRAPVHIGETVLGEHRALVTEYLPGFQIEAAHVPAGPGAARSLGAAIAGVHGLPASVVRGAGLPDRSAAESRAELRALVDRAASTGRVPARLIVRWQGALDEEPLWQFAPLVTLGGAQATSFLFEDDPVAGPTVIGVVGWHGLSIGDPAVDLAWVSTAPDAAADIHRSYAAAITRAPDEAIAARARLRAELEFARWLVHGEDLRREDIVDDAAALLDALAESVREQELAEIAGRDQSPDAALQSALGAAERVPTGTAPTIDTSMQTDTYTPEELWVAQDSPATTADPQATQPVDDSEFGLLPAEQGERGEDPEGTDPEETEAQRAARAALHRWTSSSSE